MLWEKFIHKSKDNLSIDYFVPLFREMLKKLKVSLQAVSMDYIEKNFCGEGLDP